jgi:multisubunit Na+/H+ antiporter MnhC subunit
MNCTIIGIELFFALFTTAVVVGLALLPLVLVLIELRQQLQELRSAS